MTPAIDWSDIEPRLLRARPCSASTAFSLCNDMPPSTVTVQSCLSTRSNPFILSMLTMMPWVHAKSEGEWPLPNTLTFLLCSRATCNICIFPTVPTIIHTIDRLASLGPMHTIYKSNGVTLTISSSELGVKSNSAVQLKVFAQLRNT